MTSFIDCDITFVKEDERPITGIQVYVTLHIHVFRERERGRLYVCILYIIYMIIYVHKEIDVYYDYIKR